jgi:two-component system sensor histidine kinase KdpD
MARAASDLIRLAAGLAAVAAVSFLYVSWLHVSNPATVSVTFLLVVLLVAATSRFWVAAVTSVAAMLSFNFLFLPPVGALTIADPQNWIALFAFLVVSLIGSNLSAVARTRTEEAVGRRDELNRLFELSRDVLVTTDSDNAMSILARSVARRFDLERVGIALPRGGDWDLFEGGAASIALEKTRLAGLFESQRTALDIDAEARVYPGHRTLIVDGRPVRFVPLRVGTKAIGLLGVGGRPIEPGTLDTLAGVVAIAIERAHFLEERKDAELTRRSEALKTTLLASLGHDLRTPLTAMRVAASNVKATWLTEQERAEQSDLILAEVERLTTLFENILEMVRIDAGAVAAESRWTHPSEILEAARDQVGHTLQRHTLDVHVAPDLPVRVDPRLTAGAVARLLENAAQYAPAGTTVHVDARVTAEGLVVAIRDHGPGIDPAELPHLFDRFYRGAAAKTRASGTGMGLWIAKGLLAAERGRISAETCPDGGSLFTIVVPAAVKESGAAASPFDSTGLAQGRPAL